MHGSLAAGVVDARGPAATLGLTVHLHTDARYQSSPPTLQIILLIAYALSLLVGVRDVGVPGPPQPRRLVVPAEGTQRAGRRIGGQLHQRVQLLGEPVLVEPIPDAGWGSLGGWGLLWMRLLPVVYGLGAHALLRLLLATALGSGLHQNRPMLRRCTPARQASRWLRARSWSHRLGAVGLLLAATTAVVPVGFGDATLGDVLESTAVRMYYPGPTSSGTTRA